jgi:hypothetical protein
MKKINEELFELLKIKKIIIKNNKNYKEIKETEETDDNSENNKIILNLKVEIKIIKNENYKNYIKLNGFEKLNYFEFIFLNKNYTDIENLNENLINFEKSRQILLKNLLNNILYVF